LQRTMFDACAAESSDKRSGRRNDSVTGTSAIGFLADSILAKGKSDEIP
jgi:hypothetical protein